MPKYLTKTFTESRYYHKRPLGPAHWEEVPRSETGEVPLDLQVQEWVERTGHMIVNPGQLGMHSEWIDEARTCRCTLFGLTVLYVEAEVPHGKQEPTQGHGQRDYDDGPDGGGAGSQGYAAPPC